MFALASKRYFRYSLSNEREDLDKQIVHLTELILLSPLSWPQHGPNILSALFTLARALIFRSDVSKQPEDVVCATNYLSHLRDQPHEIPSIPHYRVTAMLVDALALQVELEAGNAMQNIREMAVLSRELLETSDVDATHLIIIIYAVVISKIYPDVSDQPLDELIEFSRVARKRRPDLLEGRITFAMSLVLRYRMTSANDDYKEAAFILDEIIAYRSPGNSHDESVAKTRAFATVLVTLLTTNRSIVFPNPENLEEAIYRTRTCVSSPSVKEHYALLSESVVFDPAAIAKRRFRHCGPIERVEESSGDWSRLLSQKSAQALGRMQDLLFGIRDTNDTTEIDEAIEKGRSIALVSSPDAPW